ncbi:DoxX family protein (modular protein) [Bradyrhizobium sp. STM 3843]|uniref:DoxX family protein n=1 Tax=Bradyrhizobium sp. STM 3843 TaxID=551947 RepID=UPI0002403AA4|nr:DoxX family protein [Bradyrhizobium sp. STM 3843]CCE10889.1 DoxX family protein (modular protein) [Bradyrhizobium sp. STM 3843]
MVMSDASHSAQGRNRHIGRIVSVLQDLMSSGIARWAPIPLRLIVGYGFAEHGFAKLLRGTDNFTGLLHALGLPAAKFMALLTIATEIIGGICIALGALVPLISIPMAIVLLVAIFTVHLQYGFSSIKLQAITPDGARFGQPGYETDLLYLACLVGLVLGGSGPFAVDTWLLGKITPPKASAAVQRDDTAAELKS